MPGGRESAPSTYRPCRGDTRGPAQRRDRPSAEVPRSQWWGRRCLPGEGSEGSFRDHRRLPTPHSGTSAFGVSVHSSRGPGPRASGDFAGFCYVHNGKQTQSVFPHFRHFHQHSTTAVKIRNLHLKANPPPIESKRLGALKRSTLECHFPPAPEERHLPFSVANFGQSSGVRVALVSGPKLRGG